MRLVGLDIARFLAFTGMVLVNFRLAAEVTPGSDWTSYLTNALEGRAAALFVVLAGLGFALAQMSVRITLSRAAFLMVLGLFNQTIFEADILHFYALYFLVAILFIRASPKLLFLGALAFPLVWLGLAEIFDYERGWDWKSMQYADFWTIEGFLRHSLFNGWHPVVPWAGFFLIGMWAGRLDLHSKQCQLRLLFGGALVSIGTMFLAGYLSELDPEIAEIAELSPIPPGPFYMVAASASALGAIGLILLMTPALSRMGLATFLAAAGRQSLTLYLAHILIGMGIMEAMGWLDGSMSPRQVFAYSLGFCLIAALYARLWSARFRRGPLEALMRRVAG